MTRKRIKLKKVLRVDQLPELSGVEYKAVTTNIFEKAIPSLLNAIIAFGIATPFLLIFGSGLFWKVSVIVIFGLYEGFMYVSQRDRCFGMKIMDTYWRHKYSNKQHLIYNIFYMLSFATILIHVWFPLDLLIINIFFIQLPMVLIKGNTLHGYLGGMHTVKVVPIMK
jgi:hypothetical protein